MNTTIANVQNINKSEINLILEYLNQNMTSNDLGNSMVSKPSYLFSRKQLTFSQQLDQSH